MRAPGGRGPVAVALPEDVLVEETTVADTGRYMAVTPGVASDAIPALRALLAVDAATSTDRARPD